MDGEARGKHQPQEIGPAAPGAKAHPGQQRQRRGVQQPYHQPVVASEQNGAGFHPDLEIVLAVAHGVERVVGDHPADVRRHQRSRLAPGHRAAHRRVGHGDAPGKRQSQVRLRQRVETLGEGIAGREPHRRQRQPKCGRRQAPGRRQRRQAQQHEQHQRLARRNPPRRDRPVPRTRHVRIEPAVRVVVDHAARRAHQHRARHEDCEQFDRRHATGRQPQGPQRGPEQKIDADGPMQAHQAGVVGESGFHGFPLPNVMISFRRRSGWFGIAL